jgi:hypothetical protein
MRGRKGMARLLDPKIEKTATKMASNIEKEDFLRELKAKWYPYVKKHSDPEVEMKKASERMKGNKFASGIKHTEEWKEANSKRMKGKNHPLFGKKLSPERCKASGELKKGIKASANTKKKMSESGKRAWELRKLTLVNPN